ncbi:hypothetical protein [Microcystis aeruginosa]|nr:hypothetical protein [Microcystis aeruginosa]
MGKWGDGEVGCGVWGVGCGVMGKWGVGCGVWGVGWSLRARCGGKWGE